MTDTNQYSTCVRNFVNGFLGFPRGRVVGKGELLAWPKRWGLIPSQQVKARLSDWCASFWRLWLRVARRVRALGRGCPGTVRVAAGTGGSWLTRPRRWSSSGPVKPTARLRPPWPVGRCGCTCMIYRLSPGIDVLRETCWQEREDAWEMERALQSNRRRMPRSWTGGGTTHPALDRAVWLVWPRQGPQRIVRTILRNRAARPGSMDIHPDACYRRQTDIPARPKLAG